MGVIVNFDEFHFPTILTIIKIKKTITQQRQISLATLKRGADKLEFIKYR